MTLSVIIAVAPFLNFGIASLSALNITFAHCNKAVRVNIASIHKQHTENLPLYYVHYGIFYCLQN